MTDYSNHLLYLLLYLQGCILFRIPPLGGGGDFLKSFGKIFKLYIWEKEKKEEKGEKGIKKQKEKTKREEKGIKGDKKGRKGTNKEKKEGKFGKFFKMYGGKFFKMNGTIYIPVYLFSLV